MTKSDKTINPGGINGTGEGVVNINSKDYKVLQNTIIAHAQQQSTEEKIKYELIGLRLQMNSYIAEANPTELISVGMFLKRFITAIKVKNKQLANYLEIEESNLSAIIRDKRKINIDFAFKLGQLFEIDPNYWLLIQNKNELLQLDKKLQLKYQKYRLDELLRKAS